MAKVTDAKFFTTTKKGEIFELKEDLNSSDEKRKKDAVKKTIQLMTTGRDASVLFTDVLNCIQTNNLELKKLVYLYVMNYAKTHPDRAILAVNTFKKDSEDHNPLIRALAIRTMGCIRVDKIVEYLCEPLRRCLKDSDPYVLKTAAICVAKLYDINPQLVEEQGFLDQLRDLLNDSTPMVVANAVAALSEIDEVSSTPVFVINKNNISKLLAALEECTEWGQVFILNALAKYEPRDSKEAEVTATRVTPRLQHANSAVVLAAVKVLMKFMEYIENQGAIQTICTKLSPPLVTLLSKEPEIQYVALRNINLILQKRPSVLQNEMKVFFCKYNDPIYVKMEKLEIMIMLCSDKNVDQVLLEFKEYAQEVDVEFVRRSVRAIGRCAIKLERAAEKCVHVLLDLIKTKVNYVVQEAVIVIKDIFRRYPNRYESVIAALCENLESLDEPEAKASMIWIIGEYAERIDNAGELLESFLETFKDESAAVQLQLLTAVVKLFLKRPRAAQDMVQTVLNMATQDSDNPDLRDRGYLYWRLLSTDADAAKQVVLAQKPLISETSERLDPRVLDELIANISTLSSVYHKPPETFVPKLKGLQRRAPLGGRRHDEDEDEDGELEGSGSNSGSIIDVNDLMGALPSTGGGNAVGDLMTGGGGSGSNGNFFAAPTNTASAAKTIEKQVVLPASPQSAGMEIRAAFARRNGQIYLDMNIGNPTPQPLGGLLVQVKPNVFRLTPANKSIDATLQPGQAVDYSMLLTTDGPAPQEASGPVISFAIKNNVGIGYFTVPIPAFVLFVEDSGVDRKQYIETWKQIPTEKFFDINQLSSTDVNFLQNRMVAHNVSFIARRKGEENSVDVLYMSAKLITGAVFLLELTFSGNTCSLCTKTTAEPMVPYIEKSIQYLLQ